ncbi:unnamed protein product [Knipowitschia caucasica]|uniref:G-protein coupled receptors family 1 profile domain-containing protein n=1 Tax=Knipowitschia caucasica TaxID=637954 RepID=A0AAV2J6A7_KNICA
MPNSTSSLLVLDSVWEGYLSPLYFLLAVTLYLLTVAVNFLLMAVIVRRPSLHAPMFLFLCSLFLNAVVGVSLPLPFLWAPLLSPKHTLSLGACSMQMFLMYCYSSVEIFNLAALAFDRYSAICFPLTYAQRVTPRTVLRALLLMWGVGLAVGTNVSLLVHLVSFCNYFDLSTLVCAEDLFIVFYIQVFELLYMCTVLLGTILFILYTSHSQTQ